MSNRVAPFDPIKNPIEIKTIQKKLVEASNTPFVVGISEPATLRSDGTAVTPIKTPF